MHTTVPIYGYKTCNSFEWFDSDVVEKITIQSETFIKKFSEAHIFFTNKKK